MTGTTLAAAGRIAAAVFALASLWWSSTAIFAAFLALLGWVTLSASTSYRKAWQLVLLAVMGVSLFGLVRFVKDSAMPGIVKAQARRAEADTISRLREILFAQDTARQRALYDPDGDGIGSALSLRELAGIDAIPGGQTVSLLSQRFVRFRGLAEQSATLIDGMLYRLCLPVRNAEAEEGHDAWRVGRDADTDTEASEQKWRAYAWPATKTQEPQPVFSIDALENIQVARGATGFSEDRPPPCDAVDGASRREPRATADLGLRFVPWRGKKPRDVPRGISSLSGHDH